MKPYTNALFKEITLTKVLFLAIVSNVFIMKNTVIKYDIDNFSGIRPLSLLKDDYDDKTHYKFRKKEYVIPTHLVGCYFLYDKNNTIIYIGKTTTCIRSRIMSHCFAPPSKYLSEYAKERLFIKRKSAHFFSYILVEKRMIDFVERGLINKYHPSLNIEFVNV